MKHPTSAPCFCTCALPNWDGGVLGFILFNCLASTRGLVLDPWLLLAGSVHGTNDYMRWVGRSQEERSEQRKAARLCLDTSAHAGTEFQRLMTVLSNVSATSHGCDHSGCYGGTVLVDKAALHFNGAQ